MMKKLFTLIMMGIMSTVLYAQTNPNRILVTSKLGETKGFLVERTDSVWFAKVEGRIAAEMDFMGYKTGPKGDTLTLSVTRMPGCEAFRIECLPAGRADMLSTEDMMANYVDGQGSAMYWQDFTEAQMSGFEDGFFKPDSKYSIITVGYDKYGIACGAERVDFSTPKKPVVGDCGVTAVVAEVGTDRFSITVTPESGVDGYYVCSFLKGEAQEQYEMWGPMFGFANMGDMIKQFGQKPHKGTETIEWTGMTPGTEYEVYVLPCDVNGTYADMVVVPVTTKKLGGEGVAEMNITIGEFGGDPINGYWQDVTYTPNDQVSMHRDIIMEKKIYEEKYGTDDKIIELLKTDMPGDPYWDQYGVDEARWNADPETEYIAYSIAQNINGEWGPLAKVPFTTPKASGGIVPPSAKKAPVQKGMPSRIVKTTISGKTTVPAAMFKAAAKAVQGKVTLSKK